MSQELWRNQIEQINVLPDLSVELVPRVGDHIVYLGRLPSLKSRAKRMEAVTSFVDKKMNRLEKFYKYGLSQAGWNRYSYINLEFDNQIICKRKDGKRDETESVAEAVAESDAVGGVIDAHDLEQEEAPVAASGTAKTKTEPKQQATEDKRDEAKTSAKKAEPKKNKASEKSENGPKKPEEKKKQKLNR